MGSQAWGAYRERILGYLGSQEPLAVLAATPRKLERVTAGATAARLRRRPAPGKWSAAEILAHLADCEAVFAYRYRAIAGQPGSTIQGFDQEAWAANLDYPRRPARASLEAVVALRRVNLALLRGLRPEQWKLSGNHAERGPETLDTVVRMVAGHDLNHLQQLQAALGPGSARR
ncbi:MAG: DinB family protein [Terriglobales bacterium]